MIKQRLLFGALMALAASTADGKPSDTSLTGNQLLGECIVQAMPSEAHNAVLSTVTNGQFNKLYGNPMRKACGAAATAKESEYVVHLANPFRSVLAESLVRAQFSQVGPSDLSAVPPLWHVAAIKPYSVSSGHRKERDFALKESETRRFLSIYGECIARENPEAVRQLLLTLRDSEGERQHFDALQPQLSACLNKGVSMQLDAGLIRESLAYNYYRLAAAANSVAQGSK
jgi:hypothetical protein